MIHSTTFSHNLNTILNFQTGTNLTVDDKGHLAIESASTEKTHLLSKVWSSNKYKITHVKKVLNDTCQKLFNEIIQKNSRPLISTSLSLADDRIKVNQVLKQLSTIGSDILNPKLKADLKELAETPETLEARIALEQGITPTVLNQTISGTYIMRNRLGKPWGIFKPQCQEVGGSKNPSWIVWAFGRAEQWGIDSGTGYLREWAAYCLDKDHFSDVPLTIPTHFQHSILDTSVIALTVPDLVGSFQLFKNDCHSGNDSLKLYEFFPIKLNRLLPNILSSLVEKTALVFYRFLFYCGLPHIPSDQIHKIAILDIRLLNCDRHFGNFLVHKQSKTVYPIDHGLILPAKANRIKFDWRHLVQSHMPFSNKELTYIRNLNTEQDVKILKKCGIHCSEAIERMKLSTKLLQECALRGLTLYQIADLMLGNHSTENVSYFENVICKKILERGENPRLVISEAIDNYLA